MKAKMWVLLALSAAQILLPLLFLSLRSFELVASSCALELPSAVMPSRGGSLVQRCRQRGLFRSTSSSKAAGTTSSRRRRRRRLAEESSPSDDVDWSFKETTSPRVTPWDVLHRQAAQVRVEEADLALLRAASGAFNLTDARTHVVLRLVKLYTEPWAPVPVPLLANTSAAAAANTTTTTATTASSKLKAVWTVRHVRDAVLSNAPLACCAHVRVVDGQVFLRYGLDTLKQQFRLDRANDLLSFLQATVRHYGLRHVRADLLFNTCDHAMARSGAMPGDRANYLVWTPHVTRAADTDLLVPDLLDLRPVYMPTSAAAQAAAAAASDPFSWSRRRAGAVFRGATTNYPLRAGTYNWVTSPRLRLHRLSDGVLPPGALDARVSRWSHGGAGAVAREAAAGGIRPARALNETHKSAFRYEVMADGGLGGGRLCGVLRARRAVVAQTSPFFQFFYPLLQRGRHLLDTQHAFGDLPALLSWMRAHDGAVRAMADRAVAEVGWTCTVRGRMLAFAVLLVKYHALVDPGFYDHERQLGEHRHHPDVARWVVVPPRASRCEWGPARWAHRYRGLLPRDDRVQCEQASSSSSRSLRMEGCPSTCFKGLQEADWRWVAADDLEGVPGMDWWKTHVPLE